MTTLDTKKRETGRRLKAQAKRAKRQERREQKRNRDKTPCIESSAIPQCEGPTK